jgi:hypothetical protein
MLRSQGAFNKSNIVISDDTELFGFATNFDNVLDSQFRKAVLSSKLSKEVADINLRYGETKDLINVFHKQVMSEKKPVEHITKLLRGEMGPDARKAITDLSKHYPSFLKQIKHARVYQAGIDTQPLLSNKVSGMRAAILGGAVGGTVGGAIVGSAATGGVALPIAAAALAANSPRTARFIAKNLVPSGAVGRSVKGLVKNAEGKAKALMSLSTHAGFLNTLGRAEANRLMTNADELGTVLEQMADSMQKAESRTSENVMQAAQEAANEPRK